MHDSEGPKENGAFYPADPALEDPRSIGNHARQIRHDATAIATEVQRTTADLERYVTDQVRRQPYGTLGAAAAIGYLLGGGFRSQLTVVLLGVATRIGAVLVTRQLAELGEHFYSVASQSTDSNNEPSA